jgi:DNA-binding transcriptional ArsR family regulator
MIESPTADRIAVVLHALGESTRLMILRDLIPGELCVNEIATAVQRPVVNISHHLGVLRNANLVTCERRGRQRIYAINPELFTPAADGSAVFQFDGVRVVLAAPERGTKKRKK